MAYKFQSGLARLDGTLALDTATDKLLVSGSTSLASLSLDNLAITGALGATSLQAAKIGINADPDLLELADGALTVNGTIEASTSLTIGGAALTEAELEKLDQITNGTVAANKAVVVDANKDASGFRDISGRTLSGSGNATFLGNAAFDGSVTAGTSIIIGSADLNEADMEKLDGITNGTVAASKAIVVDGNKDFSGFRNMSGSGELQLVGAATIQGDITTSGSLVIGNASMSETDLEKLDGITNGTAAANKAVVLDASADITGIRNLTITGDLDVAGAINRVTTNETELAIEDVRIIIGSGSAGASQLDGGGIFFGSPGSGKAIAEIAFNDAAEDELVFAFSGSEAFKVDSGGDLTAQGDLTIAGAIAGATTIGASGVATVGGLTVGSAVLNEADLEQIDDLTAGTVTVSKAVVVNATKDITSFNSLTAVAVTGSVSVSSPSGSITDLFVGDDLEVKGNLVSHAANTHHGVATHNANINVTGAVGVGALIASSVVSAAGVDATNVGAGALTTTHNGQLGSIQVTGSTQLGYSSSFAAGGSLQAVSNTVLVGGLVASGRNNIVSGSLAAEGAPSFLEVIPSGSEDIKLFVEPPAVTAGGKMITIKYFGQDGVLVLTGSGASNMTFDGLAALTMSSPFAAVNLFWNGSAYSIY